jgi:hypothetical protein
VEGGLAGRVDKAAAGRAAPVGRVDSSIHIGRGVVGGLLRSRRRELAGEDARSCRQVSITPST